MDATPPPGTRSFIEVFEQFYGRVEDDLAAFDPEVFYRPRV